MKYKVWFRNWANESISFTVNEADYRLNAQGKYVEFLEGGTYEITAKTTNDSSYVPVKKEFIIDDYCVIDCCINAERHELELKNPLAT